MKYIRKDMFDLLSNMDKVIVYLLLHKGSYVKCYKIERACHLTKGTAGSYIKWLRFKGIVKRRRVSEGSNVKYIYSINKLAKNKQYLQSLIITTEHGKIRDGNTPSITR